MTSPARQVGANVARVEADDLDAPERVYAEHQGVGVWTRPDTIRARHAIMFEEHGIPTRAEIDDNHLSPAYLNLFLRANRWDRDVRRQHLKGLSVFQRVIFSTAWLRDRYFRAFKELGRLPQLAVARNHVDLDDWPEPTEGKRLRVGWMGSAQHVRDIKLAAEALTWVRGAGHEVVHMGHDPRITEGVTNPKAVDVSFAWSSIITRQIPWTDPEVYHRQALPLDIGLAPLERNDHTLGKSDVKWLEYTMSGAATIASQGTVYSEIAHGETGLLAGSPDEFTHWVKVLCRDHKLRERLVSNAAEYIKENRTMQVQGKREWEDAIRA